MTRFLVRHWTGVLVTILVAGWAFIYLPTTPSYAVFQLKRAIDARDGDAAARYVNFPSVVKHAGYEIVKDKESGGGIGQLLGKAAVDLLSQPMAMALKSWAKRQVEDGAKDVQMPPAAVAASVVLLHRDGDTAYTDFHDSRGRVWKIHMARAPDGTWQIVQVENIKQLLEQLKPRTEAPAAEATPTP